MKKLILIIFFEVLFGVSLLFAQTEEERLRVKIAEKKEEKERLYNCKTFFENQKYIKNHYYDQKIAIVEVEPNSMNKNEFKNLCQEYSREVVEFERNLKYDPNVTDYHIVYACNQKNETTEINMYYEVTSNTSINFIKEGDDAEIRECELLLNKIRNNQKLCKELSDILQRQINYNLIETADNAGNLLLKHVSIPNGEELKTNIMEELKKAGGVENEKPIDNKTANILNKGINLTEKVVEFIPGGDKLTNHYLWKLFKSTPEAGKGLGHLAASVNIYFRKNEYEREIQKLKIEEEIIIKKIEDIKNRNLNRENTSIPLGGHNR
ncbi:MAG: hypothetical protein LBQ22_08685 [Bacteroidales bacterium]|jgi:hypothetical protein|nr:hypothetical protein [Bacteroidales bacterium]